jgi:hypothetical protein
MLYHSDNMFEIIPKAWFANYAQIEEFRRIARHVGT